MTRLPFLALVCGIVLAAGCAREPKRRQLSGKVTYAGKPVLHGTIYFEPDRSQGRGGPQGAGEIRDGVYHTNPNYGPLPGPTVIRITGWDQPPGMSVAPAFTDYETRVDLPDEDKKDFDFDIPLVKAKRKN